jgi:hypothetical protein
MCFIIQTQYKHFFLKNTYVLFCLELVLGADFGSTTELFLVRLVPRMSQAWLNSQRQSNQSLVRCIHMRVFGCAPR